jgi:uncharacterized low-complexity protein
MKILSPLREQVVKRRLRGGTTQKMAYPKKLAECHANSSRLVVGVSGAAVHRTQTSVVEGEHQAQYKREQPPAKQRGEGKCGRSGCGSVKCASSKTGVDNVAVQRMGLSLGYCGYQNTCLSSVNNRNSQWRNLAPNVDARVRLHLRLFPNWSEAQ